MNWQTDVAAFIEVDGQPLEARCYGPSPDEAATIVLLHEGLGCVALWRDFPEQLVEGTGLGVFVYSRAGYGGSNPITLPRPLDYMTLEACQVLPQVLDTVGVQRCVLLGHSDGASIAAIHGGSVQDARVRGLILMAPHFFTEPAGLAAIREARDAYDSGDLKSRLARYHAQVDVAFRGWNDAWLAPGFVEWNIEDVIDYIRVPVLAIQGEDDQYGSIAQIDALEHRLYSPLERHVLAACRHSPHLEQNAQTLVLISDFIMRLQRIEQAGSD